MLPRPIGSSIWSDISKAGAGFAAGLAEERKRQQDERISAQMREFAQNLQTKQLGLQEKQFGLQQEQFGLEKENSANQEIDRQFNRAARQQDLRRQTERDAADEFRWNADRALRREELKQQAQLAREQMGMNLKIARIQNADENNRMYVSQLAALDDDYRSERNDLIKDPDVFGALYDKTNAKAKLETQARTLQPGSPESNRVLDKLAKIQRLEQLDQERTQNRIERQRAIRTGQGITKELGGDPGTTDTDWSELDPATKMAAKQRMVNIIVAKQRIGEPIPWEKWQDDGLTMDEMQEISAMASQVQAQTPPATPQPVPTSTGRGVVGPAGVPLVPAGPPAPRPNTVTGPAGVPMVVPSPAQPGPVSMQDALSPENTLLRRGSVMNGPMSNGAISAITPNARRQFLADSVNRHRIPR